MQLYLRALAYYRPDAPRFLRLLFLSALGVGLGLLAPWPLAILVDTVLARAGDSHAGDWLHNLILWPMPETVAGQVVGLAVLTLVIKALQEGVKLASTMTGHLINYGGLLRVRCDLFRKLQSMTPLEHGRMPEGDAVYRLCYDAHGFNGVWGTLFGAFVAVFTLAWVAAVMFSRSVPLTLVSLSVLPILVTANVWYGRQLAKRAKTAKEVETRMVTGLQRTMGAISLVQAFGRESEEMGRFSAEAGQSVSAWIRLHWQEVAYWLVVGMTFGLGSAVVFGYGGLLASKPGGGLTPGDLVVFLSYLGMLFDPLCRITGLSFGLAQASVGVRRVFEVLDRQPPVAEKPGALPLPVRPRTITLENVAAEYDAGRPVLHGISMVVRPGESVALIGPSGGGKSTLLNLLPRFMDPSAGRVSFDGIDLRDCRLADVRRHLAVVLQDPVLLPASMAENIAYGRPGATADEVREAARLSGALEFIDALPEGMGTKVGREGMALSGGQRQRIAIARALLSGAPVLVLDEPTSALDRQGEMQVVETLSALRGLRTVIIVTHRPAPVAACDRVIELRGGRVVDEGPADRPHLDTSPAEEPAAAIAA